MITSKLDGRIRAQDDKLKNSVYAKKLCTRLKRRKGITNLKHTELIGTLLVEYESKKIKTATVIKVLSEYIDCKEQPSAGSRHSKSSILDRKMAGSSNKKKSVFGKKQPKSGRGPGQRGRRQGSDNVKGFSLPLNDVLKNILPFTEGNSPLSNIVKSLISSAIGYQAYQFGRGRLGGGRGRK
jgi:hypothetical protein